MRILYAVRIFSLFAVAIIIGLLVGFRLNAWLQESETVAELSPANGFFVETDYGRIHVSQWGEETGKPVIMTHGMAAWGGLWSEIGGKLADEGYRVLAVDQPPFGFSDRQNPDFSRSTQALRLQAVAEGLGLDQYTLIGHSYGGGIAMETALVDESNVAGIVLVCPVMAVTPDGETAQAGSVPFPLRSDWLAEMLVSVSVTNPFLTGFLTKQFMYQKASLTDRHIKILQRPMRLRGNTSYMVAWLRQFLQGDPEAASRQKSRLAEFSKPVSMIWGEEDTVTPIALGEELEQILKPKVFHRMSNIGHMPQLEAPEEFGALLLNGLQKLQD